MNILLNVIVFVTMAIYMEYVAWFTHKYVMHGFLWVLHEDHHRPRHRGLQKNDLFAVFFSAISFVTIYAGLLRGVMPLTSAGLGIALYGVGYVLFHDVMFHRRIPGLRIQAKGPYLERIVRAHRIHHQRGGRTESTAFGFLYAPKHIPQPGMAK
jgi:beta-carotene 3-hydroxylase